MTIKVVKSDGSIEEFQPRKIMRTLRRAGASRETADKIINKIMGELYDGITTKDILKRVKALFPKNELHAAMRYDLKGAIMRLGPAGFPFETFVAELLQHYGYKTKLRSIIKGRCVRHEVDVIAERTNGDMKKCMIECKFHNLPGNSVDLKDVLYTYARFLDLNEGSLAGMGGRFDEVWLVSNTRASPDATRYANCRGMRLLCWLYPRDIGLEKMIEEKGLYPVTALRSVDRETLEKLFTLDLMLAKDFVDHDISYLRRTGLSNKKINRLILEAKQLIAKIGQNYIK